jgi:hypothetical protein
MSLAGMKYVDKVCGAKISDSIRRDIGNAWRLDVFIARLAKGLRGSVALQRKLSCNGIEGRELHGADADPRPYDGENEYDTRLLRCASKVICDL